MRDYVEPVELLEDVRSQVRSEQLVDFVAESNRIENIDRAVTPIELHAHEHLLRLERLTIKDIEAFVGLISTGKLRENKGDNVHITGRSTEIMPGGPAVVVALKMLLDDINRTGDKESNEPWTPVHRMHCLYETLHPFTDGNGRSGRAIWAWQMRKLDRDPFSLPFLRRFYYDALEASR